MQQENRAKRGVRPSKAAERLGVSLPTFWRYARTIPDFPKLIRLSVGVTIVDEDELDAYVDRRRMFTASPRKRIAPPDADARNAAAALGCRLVGDMSPAELAEWTAAGRPQLVKVGEYELVPIKALQRMPACAPTKPAVPPARAGKSVTATPLADAPPKRGPGRPRKHHPEQAPTATEAA